LTKYQKIRHKSFDKGKLIEKWGRKAIGASLKDMPASCLTRFILRFMNLGRMYGKLFIIFILVSYRSFFGINYLFQLVSLSFSNYKKRRETDGLFHKFTDCHRCYSLGCYYELTD
jgi:hypothetical protein